MMAKPPEQPIEETIDDRGEVISTHPAFAQIGVSRISGGGRVLYGSDFTHNNYVRVRLSYSEMRRHLANDWHHSKGSIVEVDLSEAQWATFVSSMNIGGGVPATLSSIGRESIPYIPHRDEGQLFKPEASAALSQSIAALDELSNALEDELIKMPKKQAAAVIEKVRVARQRLSSSIPFIVEQFGEHMEKRAEKAKMEINAYATHVLVDSGLAALANNQALPISLPAPKDDRDGE